MNRTPLVVAALLAPLCACSEAPAVVPPTPAGVVGAVELPSEAGLLERARAEIAPEQFDAELERLRREILGAEPKPGRQ